MPGNEDGGEIWGEEDQGTTITSEKTRKK